MAVFCRAEAIKPGEALVLTLFGKYVGTLKKDGFFFVNPFCTAVNPTVEGGTRVTLRCDNRAGDDWKTAEDLHREIQKDFT